MSRTFVVGWKFLLLATGVFILTFLLFFLSREGRLNSPESVYIEQPATIFLDSRISLDELIEVLHEYEADFSEDELRWASQLLGWRWFNTGRYDLTGHYSYQELLSKLALGLQDHAAVTIPSGSSKQRLSAALGRQLRAESDDFLSILQDEETLAAELGLTTEELFARLLPDTYNFYWTTSPERVIRRIYQEFERRVADRYIDEIEQQDLTLDELVTLASIVEWEAAHNEEKAMISGLYHNRLQRNMRLQADPTVIYALGEHRRLLYEDYRVDHPYNTYRIQGLPPGPITNPDLHSIQAAIFPEDHDYLYMVASPGGGHVFSRTFDEHRQASAEWRRWIQEQYRLRDLREQEEGS